MNEVALGGARRRDTTKARESMVARTDAAMHGKTS